MKRYYILHYFDPANVGSFLLVSLLGLILVLALVLLIANSAAAKRGDRGKSEKNTPEETPAQAVSDCGKLL